MNPTPRPAHPGRSPVIRPVADTAADNARIALRRAEDTAALRSARPGKLGLCYGGGEACRWDLYPALDPAAPCIVLLHGSEWSDGGPAAFGAVARGLLAHGWSAASPSHGLRPGASLTRITRDLHRAMGWLTAQGPLHGVAGPVLLCGWGSGAHLAALLLDHPRVRAGLGLSGVYDLGPFEEGLDLTPLEVEALSPQRLPVVRKPFALAFGGAEGTERQRHSRAFHALRSQNGANDPLLVVRGADAMTLPDLLEAPDGLLCHTARALIEEG